MQSVQAHELSSLGRKDVSPQLPHELETHYRAQRASAERTDMRTKIVRNLPDVVETVTSPAERFNRIQSVAQATGVREGWKPEQYEGAVQNITRMLDRQSLAALKTGAEINTLSSGIQVLEAEKKWRESQIAHFQQQGIVPAISPQQFEVAQQRG